ncbi:MAG: hypothetical protein R3F19_34400 [Verrucomicrobiales bacterium]
MQLEAEDEQAESATVRAGQMPDRGASADISSLAPGLPAAYHLPLLVHCIPGHRQEQADTGSDH